MARQPFLGSLLAVFVNSRCQCPSENLKLCKKFLVEARIDRLPDDWSGRTRIQKGALCGDNIGKVLIRKT